MAGTDTSDPSDIPQGFGYSGTDTTTEQKEQADAITSREIQKGTIETDLLNREGSSGIGNLPSGRPVSDINVLNWEVRKLKQEITGIQQFRWQLEQAQTEIGEENLYDLLVSVGHLHDDVANLESRINTLENDWEEIMTVEGVGEAPDTQGMEESRFNIRYLIFVQIVFLLMGLAAIGISLVDSTIFGTIAIFLIPVFFALSLGGVLAERTMIQISN